MIKKIFGSKSIRMENLIEKSNDIPENLKNNEIAEKNITKKPENYFNTSDHFFHTYRLNHTIIIMIMLINISLILII